MPYKRWHKPGPFPAQLPSFVSQNHHRVYLKISIVYSCPFVTTVGGTTRVNPEIAVSFSGGGFSRYFTVPSYQQATVAKFVTGLGNQFNGLFK
jgi:tripeptidyl-peptidase-1